jgi:hypothetical protein
VKKADMQSELVQRAKFIWSDLHAPHHNLNVQSPMTIKIPYGPGQNRVDTLFFFSACR